MIRVDDDSSTAQTIVRDIIVIPMHETSRVTATGIGYSEGMGVRVKSQERIEEAVDSVFEAASDEDFEDGMESSFSRQLLHLVLQHGFLAMAEIGFLINHDRTKREVASEALRWLGRIEDERTRAWRLWLLKKGLNNPAVIIRDGAILGLAAMGDPTAIDDIRKAIVLEPCPGLREDMEQTLEELEAASGAAAAEEDTQV